MSKLHPSELSLVVHDHVPVPDDRNTEMLWGWILENERIHGTTAAVNLIASTVFGRMIAERVNQINSIEPAMHRPAANVNLEDVG